MTKNSYVWQGLLIAFIFLASSNFAIAQSSKSNKIVKSELEGLTETVSIDGQPALRILGKKGVSTEIRFKLIDGKETFVFLGATIPSIAGKSLEGKLFVSKQKVWFEPFDDNKGFEFESSKIKESEVISKDFGRWSLVKISTDDKKILFQIRFVNDGVYNGNKKYALPANNFLVKSISDFDSALSQFNELTSSVSSKENKK